MNPAIEAILNDERWARVSAPGDDQALRIARARRAMFDNLVLANPQAREFYERQTPEAARELYNTFQQKMQERFPDKFEIEVVPARVSKPGRRVTAAKTTQVDAIRRPVLDEESEQFLLDVRRNPDMIEWSQMDRSKTAELISLVPNSHREFKRRFEEATGSEFDLSQEDALKMGLARGGGGAAGALVGSAGGLKIGTAISAAFPPAAPVAMPAAITAGGVLGYLGGARAAEEGYAAINPDAREAVSQFPRTAIVGEVVPGAVAGIPALARGVSGASGYVQTARGAGAGRVALGNVGKTAGVMAGTGAATDAGVQGIMMGLGLQDDFAPEQTIASALISAPFAATFFRSHSVSPERVSQAILRVRDGTANPLDDMLVGSVRRHMQSHKQKPGESVSFDVGYGPAGDPHFATVRAQGGASTSAPVIPQPRMLEGGAVAQPEVGATPAPMQPTPVAQPSPQSVQQVPAQPVQQGSGFNPFVQQQGFFNSGRPPVMPQPRGVLALLDSASPVVQVEQPRLPNDINYSAVPTIGNLIDRRPRLGMLPEVAAIEVGVDRVPARVEVGRMSEFPEHPASPATTERLGDILEEPNYRGSHAAPILTEGGAALSQMDTGGLYPSGRVQQSAESPVAASDTIPDTQVAPEPKRHELLNIPALERYKIPDYVSDIDMPIAELSKSLDDLSNYRLRRMVTGLNAAMKNINKRIKAAEDAPDSPIDLTYLNSLYSRYADAQLAAKEIINNRPVGERLKVRALSQFESYAPDGSDDFISAMLEKTEYGRRPIAVEKTSYEELPTRLRPFFKKSRSSSDLMYEDFMQPWGREMAEMDADEQFNYIWGNLESAISARATEARRELGHERFYAAVESLSNPTRGNKRLSPPKGSARYAHELAVGDRFNSNGVELTVRDIEGDRVIVDSVENFNNRVHDPHNIAITDMLFFDNGVVVAAPYRRSMEVTPEKYLEDAVLSRKAVENNFLERYGFEVPNGYTVREDGIVVPGKSLLSESMNTPIGRSRIEAEAKARQALDKQDERQWIESQEEVERLERYIKDAEWMTLEGMPPEVEPPRLSEIDFGEPGKLGEVLDAAPQALEAGRAEATPRAAAEPEKWSPPADPEARAELRQTLEDIIAARRESGQAVRQQHIDRLAAIREMDAGNVPSEGVASLEVFGHPLATSNPEYANLIPIRVRTREALDGYIERAQKLLDDLNKETFGLDYEISKAKGAAKKKLEAKRSSANFRELEAFRDLLREQTIPELNRMYRQFPEPVESPAPRTAQQQTPRPTKTELQDQLNDAISSQERVRGKAYAKKFQNAAVRLSESLTDPIIEYRKNGIVVDRDGVLKLLLYSNTDSHHSKWELVDGPEIQ